MRRIERIVTRFQTLEVWKSKHTTEFRVAGAVHAAHHRSRLLTGLAWDLIAAAPLLRPEQPPESVLMLGLAGGTSFRILHHLLPTCKLAAVEIDAEIVALARKHMDLDSLPIEIHHADAYMWLKQNQRKFDVVIDDLYLAGKTDVFRPRAWDADLISSLRQAVAPGGLLAVNLVTGKGHRTMQSHTRRTLNAAFPEVRSLRTSESLNEVLVAADRVASPRTLSGYSECFTDWRDRMYWRRIDCRKLYS
jgi:spermidine synthase